MSAVREPSVAGLFYPELKNVLERDVDEYLLRAKSSRVQGRIIALISPHAGYVYSGLTAAVGYRLLKGQSFDSVIIVGPSHREYFNGISVYPGSSYRTPLGDMPVHSEVRSSLANADPLITLAETGHEHEHAIEVQLPFLQRTLGRCSIVPIVMGDQRPELCAVLAKALTNAAAGRSVLLVASSDLSHYHPYGEATQLDKKVIDAVEGFRTEDLLRMFEHEEAEACGGGPMAAVMLAAKNLGANKSKALFYCNSGDVTGDKDAVVGYLSAAVFQEP